jgi:hypothetical protein
LLISRSGISKCSRWSHSVCRTLEHSNGTLPEEASHKLRDGRGSIH